MLPDSNASLASRLFADHPRSVGESYGEHAVAAARFGGAMIAAGLACLVHAVVPGLFTHSASDTVRRLYARIALRGEALRRAPEPSRTWTYDI